MRFTLIILAALMLVSCAGGGESAPSRAQAEAEETITPVAAPVYLEISPESEPELEPEPEESPKIFVPEEILSPEQVVEEYFRQQYLSYTSLEYIDISSLMDLSLSRMRNTLLWLELLTQRRRLLSESGLCYVDTEMLPYEISYLKDADIEDDRVSFWQRGNITYENELMLHFVIKGSPGGVYPPIMAVNTQHTMRFRLVDGQWKIAFHYFPGSVRKFRWLEPLEIPSDEEAMALLEEEFSAAPLSDDEPEIPGGAASYDGLLAAEYAELYTEAPNESFYNIGDWMGNCANFTSQCIWYGFGDGADTSYAPVNMTSEWYAGEGGGSPAWENVGRFWDYVMDGGVLCGRELAGVTQMKLGDLVQTRAKDFDPDDPERFNHSLILVDDEKLVFAQNSPGAFVYYSDLVNVEARFFRPEYLRK